MYAQTNQHLLLCFVGTMYVHQAVSVQVSAVMFMCVTAVCIAVLYCNLCLCAFGPFCVILGIYLSTVSLALGCNTNNAVIDFMLHVSVCAPALLGGAFFVVSNNVTAASLD